MALLGMEIATLQKYIRIGYKLIGLFMYLSDSGKEKLPERTLGRNLGRNPSSSGRKTTRILLPHLDNYVARYTGVPTKLAKELMYTVHF